MSTDRAQTTLDFAVGAGVFLLAVVFVVAFVPGALAPFAGDQEHVVVADRVANELAGGLLGDPADPYVLNASCTMAFFENESDNGNYGVDPGCSFRDVSLVDRLDVNGTLDPNVQVRLVQDLDGDREADTLCVDWNDDRTIVEADGARDGGEACDLTDTANNDILLATGESAAGTDSVAVARRTVHLEGLDDGTTQATLVVRVW